MRYKGSSPGPGLRPGEYRTLAGLRHTLRRFLRFSEEAARAHGVSPRQHQALLAVRGAPTGTAVTIGDLAEQLQIRHHSAVGLVQRLEGRGLLRRRADRQDRRRVQLRVTARGERLLAALSAVHEDELRRIGPGLITLLEQVQARAGGRPG